MSSSATVTVPIGQLLPDWVPVLNGVDQGEWFTQLTTHVWRIDLDLWQKECATLFTLLSKDEQERANRFVRAIDQQRFIVSRGVLRQLLGQYCAIAPDAITFHYTPQGKPILAASPTPSSRPLALQFNLSHSHHLGLYAFTVGYPIGVDLEQLRPIPVLQLAQRFYRPAELESLRSLPSDQQPLTFLQYWTLKEAYLKATGRGIGGLNEVEVNQEANPHQRLFRIGAAATSEPTVDCSWWMAEFVPKAGFVAALAIATPQVPVIAWYDLVPREFGIG